MVDLITLVTAYQDRLRLIPELVAALGGDSAAISAYVDLTPALNNAVLDIYELPAGSLRIYYELTDRDAGNEMQWWAHHVSIVMRAPSGQSNMRLATLVVNGFPVPGDGQKWWLCPLLDGLEPTQILEVSRVSDAEAVDYFLITTQINETGDL